MRPSNIHVETQNLASLRSTGQKQTQNLASLPLPQQVTGIPKFKDKYRIETTRLPHWDYSANGYYFVTICTHDRRCYLGEISDKTMRLTDIGRIAEQCWSEIPAHFPFVVLDQFTVMPNHIHGIVIINKNIDPVETQNLASLQSPSPKRNKFAPQSRNLASIIRGFKIGVKKYSTIHNIDFAWQPRFYDRIVRDEEELNRVREYITNNPSTWETDENYSA